jgi:predicted CXXCH cytochrome family protein
MPLKADKNENGRRRVPAIVALTAMWVTGLVSVGLVSAPGSNAQTAPDIEKPAAEHPAYVSNTVCAECHAKEHEAWQKSHHAWALKTATSDSVLGDFDNSVFEHDGGRSRFFKRDDRFFVETDGPGGALAEHEIKYTIGIEPLQQYLVELDRGRLQALDVAWSTQQDRWFDLYPDQVLKPGDGLHWSGPYKNWNARCAECHQTNFIKAYDPREGRYQSKWDDLTVSCESCHGPGEAHVRWAREAPSQGADAAGSYPAIGLGVDLSQGGAEREIGLCAPCHSRRSAIGPDSPPPGSEYADHYRLALLRDGLYHADGQIDDEVYVYGSFLQSRMYQRGVRCSNCHEPHSGELVAEEPNAVCAQCHNPAGNPAFPSLKKAAYDDPAHHHHQSGAAGSQCVDCHMPAKSYMQVDPRRDHSFRVPRPDLSEKLGTPNACTGCHEDQTPAWAAARVQNWFPDGRTGTPHYGEIFHEARNRPDRKTAGRLVGLAGDMNQPAIVRASALDHLRGSIAPDDLSRIEPLLEDRSDLVRSAALRLFQSAPVDMRRSSAIRLAKDPRKAVRLEAARLLIGVRLDGLSDEDRVVAGRAIAAYQRSLFAQSDYPETQMQIAGLAMVLREFPVAERALSTATRMDPQMADAWLTLARIQQALGRADRARDTLEDAAGHMPDNAIVQFQLGMLYTGLRDYERANAALARNLQMAGPSPDVLDMLAANHFALGQAETALRHARDLARQYPQHRPSPLVRQLLEQDGRR